MKKAFRTEIINYFVLSDDTKIDDLKSWWENCCDIPFPFTSDQIFDKINQGLTFMLATDDDHENWFYTEQEFYSHYALSLYTEVDVTRYKWLEEMFRTYDLISYVINRHNQFRYEMVGRTLGFKLYKMNKNFYDHFMDIIADKPAVHTLPILKGCFGISEWTDSDQIDPEAVFMSAAEWELLNNYITEHFTNKEISNLKSHMVSAYDVEIDIKHYYNAKE